MVCLTKSKFLSLFLIFFALFVLFSVSNVYALFEDSQYNPMPGWHITYISLENEGSDDIFHVIDGVTYKEDHSRPGPPRLVEVTPGPVIFGPGDIVVINGSFPLNEQIKNHAEVSVFIAWGNTREKNQNWVKLILIKASSNQFKGKVPWGTKPGDYKLAIVKSAYPKYTTSNKSISIKSASRPDLVLKEVMCTEERKKPNNGSIVVTPSEVTRNPDGRIAMPLFIEVGEVNFCSAQKLSYSVYHVAPNKYPEWEFNKHVGHCPNAGPKPYCTISGGSTKTFETSIAVPMARVKANEANQLVKVKLNPNYKVKESNRYNNTKQFTLVFNGFDACDLVVSKIEVKPEEKKLGEDLTFIISFKNIGYKRSPACMASIYWGGSSVSQSQTIPPIDPGKTWRRQLKHKFSKRLQEYWIMVGIDPDETVEEMRSNNNVKKVSFDVER